MVQADKVRNERREAAIRESDIEPYPALRWVAFLFKAGAVFLAVAMLAELVAGLSIEGWAAVPELLGELARTLVLALVLWGTGDLVRLLIHMGHDIRAERILLTRLVHRVGQAGADLEATTGPAEKDADADPREAGAVPEPASGDTAAADAERDREAAD